jgi:hypothetical protein
VCLLVLLNVDKYTLREIQIMLFEIPMTFMILPITLPLLKVVQCFLTQVPGMKSRSESSILPQNLKKLKAELLANLAG